MKAVSSVITALILTLVIFLISPVAGIFWLLLLAVVLVSTIKNANK